MAEFDFDLFIDNVLKNKSNAELMQIERMPAQEVRKLSPEDIAKNVEYGEVPLPIEYPAGYKVQVPQSEIIRQNVNPALMDREQSMKDLGANLKDMAGEYSGYKGQMQDALKNLQDASSKSYSDPDLDKRISVAQKSYEDIPEVPERDMMSEAILSFAPALFGALGGESAAVSQLPAGQKAREMYEGRRKEQIERVKTLREQADKRYKTLVEMKKSQQESFDKSQQREMDRLKSVLSGSGDLAKLSNDDLKNTEQRILDIQKDISKTKVDASSEIAKMERSSVEEANKEIRAKILAGQAGKRIDIEARRALEQERANRAKEDLARAKELRDEARRLKAGGNLSIEEKKTVENLATKNASKVAIKNQIDAVLSDWDSYSDDQKLTQGRQLLKTLNSPEGADAIGAEEANRLGAKLEFAYGNLLNSNPTQFGRDLQGFKQQAKDTADNLGKAITSNQAIIKNIESGKGVSFGGKSEMPRNKVKVSNGKETYIINRSDLSDAKKDGFKEVQ